MIRKLRVGIVGAHRGAVFCLGSKRTRRPNWWRCATSTRPASKTPPTPPGVSHLYSDYEAMLDQARLDLVVVSTPMPCHAPQATAALQRGIHVVSEVPAATDLEQCWQLVQAAPSSRAKYMMPRR